MQKFFSLFVAVVQEPALASCSNYEDSYNGCDSGSARGSPSLCSTGDDLSADEEAIHVKMRQKGRRWSEVGKNRLVLLLIHIRFVSYAIFCCFQRPKVDFFQQDIQKRLSLPNELRLPWNVVEKLNTQSALQQPLTRKNRRTSLVINFFLRRRFVFFSRVNWFWRNKICFYSRKLDLEN